MKLAIKLHTKDNVATVVEALQERETVSVLSDRGMEVDRVVAATQVPLPFHKIALAKIERGAPLFKYGEIIGYATASIGRGDWVHLHNLESANFRGKAAVRSKSHG